jgi:hypothetical protein
MSGAKFPILYYLYALTGETLHLKNNCGRFLAGTMHYEYSQLSFKTEFCRSKPHTLTMILLFVFGDTRLTVLIAVMGLVCRVFISENPVLQAFSSGKCFPMQSGRTDTHYLKFTLHRGLQIFSPAGQI